MQKTNPNAVPHALPKNHRRKNSLMPETANGLRYGKFINTIKMLRANHNTVCVVADNKHRNQYPEDIRCQVFVKQIPENWRQIVTGGKSI
jgi:hypothetical protein